MPTEHESKPKASRSRLHGSVLWLSIAATAIALGACTADREGGYTKYPERWEYRKDPSENHGRIYRY